jgi:hypothetical protein
VGVDVLVDRGGEGVDRRRPGDPAPRQAVAQFTEQLVAPRMVAIEDVEGLVRLGGAATDGREQVLVFLQMVEAAPRSPRCSRGSR